MSRVESGFFFGSHGSGRVTLTIPDPVKSDLTREKPCYYIINILRSIYIYILLSFIKSHQLR